MGQNSSRAVKYSDKVLQLSHPLLTRVILIKNLKNWKRTPDLKNLHILISYICAFLDILTVAISLSKTFYIVVNTLLTCQHLQLKGNFK